jgi:hypothetical protein
LRYKDNKIEGFRKGSGGKKGIENQFENRNCLITLIRK